MNGSQRGTLIFLGVAILAAAGAVVVVAARPTARSNSVVATSTTEPATTTTSTTARLDANGEAACRQLASLVTDAQNKIVSPVELRPRVQQLYANARLSLTPGVDTSATRLLAATTQDDLAGFQLALRDLVHACNQ